MEIDMRVTLGSNLQVNRRMLGKTLKHMVEKANACGDIELADYKPDATDWIVFVQGEEIARVRKRDDIAIEVGQKLIGREPDGT